MRTIKFRAWNGRDMLFHENGLYLAIGGGTWGIWKSDNELVLKNNDDVAELMQFTGLLDKNGKEIYEGDIVTMKHLQGFKGALTGHVVGSVRDDEYGLYDWRWWVKIKDHLVFFHDAPEVIGNIYENPELLTSRQ
jgi:uncharacterized phage protein (TIGR01671 family)